MNFQIQHLQNNCTCKLFGNNIKQHIKDNNTAKQRETNKKEKKKKTRKNIYFDTVVTGQLAQIQSLISKMLCIHIPGLLHHQYINIHHSGTAGKCSRLT